MLEKTLESPLDNKEIKPDNPKGNHRWIFIGRSDAETEALTTWWEELTHWKRFWCWKDWRQEEKGMTEDEMVGWHHRINGHEFKRILGDCERQKPGMLQSVGLQRVGHDWTIEQQQPKTQLIKENFTMWQLLLLYYCCYVRAYTCMLIYTHTISLARDSISSCCCWRSWPRIGQEVQHVNCLANDK